MEETLKRAIAQLEQASSGSMAPNRSAIATVVAAARQASDLAQENYALRTAGPCPTCDVALLELEALFGPNAERTWGTNYAKIAVEAMPSLLARVRKADDTADAYAALLKELRYQEEGAQTNG